MPHGNARAWWSRLLSETLCLAGRARFGLVGRAANLERGSKIVFIALRREVLVQLVEAGKALPAGSDFGIHLAAAVHDHLVILVEALLHLTYRTEVLLPGRCLRKARQLGHLSFQTCRPFAPRGVPALGLTRVGSGLARMTAGALEQPRGVTEGDEAPAAGAQGHRRTQQAREPRLRRDHRPNHHAAAPHARQ